MKQMINIGKNRIDLETLKSQQELLAYFMENGATHSALMDFCEEYREKYHNELCWPYPISDGKHLGTFLILVKEGVLSLPYDKADDEDYELFCLEDARLCDEDSLEIFLDDWVLFSDDLCGALREMKRWYAEKEHLECVKGAIES